MTSDKAAICICKKKKNNSKSRLIFDLVNFSLVILIFLFVLDESGRQILLRPCYYYGEHPCGQSIPTTLSGVC